ncbi:MAG: hypothetical protein J6D57_03725, partial [Mogibacterium sp.]|nr:hypothetical protein [Mogibacterium sp.]
GIKPPPSNAMLLPAVLQVAMYMPESELKKTPLLGAKNAVFLASKRMSIALLTRYSFSLKVISKTKIYSLSDSLIDSLLKYLKNYKLRSPTMRFG